MTDRLIWAHGAQERARISPNKVIQLSLSSSASSRNYFSERENYLTGIGGKAPQSEGVLMAEFFWSGGKYLMCQLRRTNDKTTHLLYSIQTSSFGPTLLL